MALSCRQGGEFAFVAFGMATSFGIIGPDMCKLLLTTVALTMAATPTLSTFSAWLADQVRRPRCFVCRICSTRG